MPDYHATRLGGSLWEPEPKHPTILAITLVMLIWGVASEALRDIISGFLDDVRFN